MSHIVCADPDGDKPKMVILKHLYNFKFKSPIEYNAFYVSINNKPLVKDN